MLTDRISAIARPTIIPRSEHTVSRAKISENALKVLYRLNKAGYESYLVGGGVRDLLLGREPKDFDVATSAHPEQVRKVFSNCRLIGRRFRLAHVHFGREIIEVATFRGLGGAGGEREHENGMLVRDNVYGTIEEDALRRDFTINALYYDVRDFSIIDYTGGMQDLLEGRLRLLGDPETRYREDPVRMLRAVRFAAKLGFRIDPECEAQISEMAPLLGEVPAARLFDEVLKLFMGGVALHSYEQLSHYGLFACLFPETGRCLEHEEQGFPVTFVAQGMKNTDARIREGKPVTPAFLFAVLLWEPVRQRYLALQEQGESPSVAMQQAASEVLSRQLQRVSLPKRFSLPMREIWSLQHRFHARVGKRPHRLLTHPRFRAAYDFLLLRAQSGEVEQELADWWTRFQEADADEKNRMLVPQGNGEKRGRRRRRRRRKGVSAEKRAD